MTLENSQVFYSLCLSESLKCLRTAEWEASVKLLEEYLFLVSTTLAVSNSEHADDFLFDLFLFAPPPHLIGRWCKHAHATVQE